MFCIIHRWNISRALDSGKPLSRLARRHLAGCGPCREFYRLGDELARRLTADAASLLAEERPRLGEKLRRVHQGLGQAESPSPALARPKRLQLRPAFAAALALIVIGVSAVWFIRSRTTGMPRLDPLLKVETRRTYVVSALERAESPYKEELAGLVKTFKSTADYLASRFDIGLGDNN